MKEVEKPGEEYRVEADAITGQAEEEVKVLSVRAKAKAFAVMAVENPANQQDDD